MNAMPDPSAFRDAQLHIDRVDAELQAEAEAEAQRKRADADAEAQRKREVAGRTADEARIAPNGPSNAWLVVITKGGKERSVRDRLTAQDFDVYLPLRLLPEAQARKRGISAVPFFPRIVLARATLDAYRWQAIFSTIGVTRVLCDPHSPKGLRPEFVRRLREREIDGFLEVGLRDPSKPAPVKVEPAKGPKWAKLNADALVEALFSEGVDEQRKSLLVSLLTDGVASATMDLRKL